MCNRTHRVKEIWFSSKYKYQYISVFFPILFIFILKSLLILRNIERILIINYLQLKQDVCILENELSTSAERNEMVGAGISFTWKP
ncbi:hypothetical protein GDO86_013908 [Hymenochirus boettgeri]|uniref:Uncharacterized protein n=1 Tax=Hymenochirus boettgeri TaxID=247094 RepID=A0A8T2JSA4_9PIPI|nr:hypothetical protein GDO86_013908 [Hymenochirus boettgeri]